MKRLILLLFVISFLPVSYIAARMVRQASDDLHDIARDMRALRESIAPAPVQFRTGASMRPMPVETLTL